MKFISLLFGLLIFSLSSIAQEELDNTPETEEPTVIEQLQNVVDKSNNYEKYKVIEKTKINEAIKLVSDELSLLNTEIKLLKDSISSKDENIQSLNTELLELNSNFDELQNEKDKIHFLGTSFSKSGYNLLVWSIIIVLVLLLLFFIFKFNRSNLLTKEAKQNLKNLDADYENYRRVALEKQQKLGRQLQDEKNKNQKSNKGSQK